MLNLYDNRGLLLDPDYVILRACRVGSGLRYFPHVSGKKNFLQYLTYFLLAIFVSTVPQTDMEQTLTHASGFSHYVAIAGA